jgi:hypothetical protein
MIYYSTQLVFISLLILDDVDQLNETSIDLVNITELHHIAKTSKIAKTNMTKKEKIRIWDMVPPGETRFHETDRYTRATLTSAHCKFFRIQNFCEFKK